MLLHIRKYRSQSKFEFYPHLISLDLPAGLSEKEPADFLPKGFGAAPQKEQDNTKKELLLSSARRNPLLWGR